MRIVLAMTLSIGVLFLWQAWGGLRASAQAGDSDGLSIQNGDVNGDGKLDIGDAVYIINFRLGNGPAPVAFAQESALTEEQSEILRHMSIVHLEDGGAGTVKTIRISGVNLQIVNGLGATNGSYEQPDTSDPEVTRTNGVGNLIVGYQEFRTREDDSNERVGSHNVIVGRGHNHSSFGGLAVGLDNTISGAYATVSAGARNTASGLHSTVSAGVSNTASGEFSTVSAGGFNTALGQVSAVSGGVRNTAFGDASSVSAGVGNTALGANSSVSGGDENTAGGTLSSVSGGAGVMAEGELDWRAGELFQDGE